MQPVAFAIIVVALRNWQLLSMPWPGLALWYTFIQGNIYVRYVHEAGEDISFDFDRSEHARKRRTALLASESAYIYLFAVAQNDQLGCLPAGNILDWKNVNKKRKF